MNLSKPQQLALSAMRRDGGANWLPTPSSKPWANVVNAHGTPCTIIPTHRTMEVLIKNGLVTSRPEDAIIYYTLTEEGLPLAKQYADEMEKGQRAIHRRLAEAEFGKDVVDRTQSHGKKPKRSKHGTET